MKNKLLIAALYSASLLNVGCATKKAPIETIQTTTTNEAWSSLQDFHRKSITLESYIHYDDFYSSKDRHFDLNPRHFAKDENWLPVWISKKHVPKSLRKYSLQSNKMVYVKITGTFHYRYTGLFSSEGHWDVNQGQYAGELIPDKIIVDETRTCEIRKIHCF